MVEELGGGGGLIAYTIMLVQARRWFKPGVGSRQALDKCTRSKDSDPCLNVCIMQFFLFVIYSVGITFSGQPPIDSRKRQPRRCPIQVAEFRCNLTQPSLPTIVADSEQQHTNLP